MGPGSGVTRHRDRWEGEGGRGGGGGGGGGECEGWSLIYYLRHVHVLATEH